MSISFLSFFATIYFPAGCPYNFSLILIIIGLSADAARRNILDLITCTLNLLDYVKNSSKWQVALNTARLSRLLTFIFFCRSSFQTQFLSSLWRNSETDCRLLFWNPLTWYSNFWIQFLRGWNEVTLRKWTFFCLLFLTANREMKIKELPELLGIALLIKFKSAA